MKRLWLLLAGLIGLGGGSMVWAANAYTQGAVQLLNVNGPARSAGSAELRLSALKE